MRNRILEPILICAAVALSMGLAPIELTRCILIWEQVELSGWAFNFPNWYRMWEELLLIWGGFFLSFVLVCMFYLFMMRRLQK